MDADEVADALTGVPYMSPEQGRRVTDFIAAHDLRYCLELGFAHGIGTAYLAHAVCHRGGKVTAIDLEAARLRQPDIYTTLRRARVDPAEVEIYFEPSSYTWRMMKFLEAGRAGTFDFIYIDGAHKWEVDGLAFYLSEKLLRPGGWVLFDDLNWTFESPSLQSLDWVRCMAPDERRTPQVRKIWELLVKANPAFDQLLEEDDWAFARKAADAHQPQVIYRHHGAVESLFRVKNMLRRARLRTAALRRQ
jgi:predicted O-methyltransferase YrrM